VLRADDAVGEAFALLTCPPGPDVAPYHGRQVVLLSPPECLRWLDGEELDEALTAPLPGGTLTVRRD
jgi:putative SOS response-associated peptidase YedK